MALALDGFNHAAEALVGKAVGSRNKQIFNLSVQLALKWSLVFGTAFTLFWLAGDWLIAMMTDLETVRDVAEIYLPWMIAMPLVSIWCFIRRDIYRCNAWQGNAQFNAGMHLCLLSSTLVYVSVPG